MTTADVQNEIFIPLCDQSAVAPNLSKIKNRQTNKKTNKQTGLFTDGGVLPPRYGLRGAKLILGEICFYFHSSFDIFKLHNSRSGLPTPSCGECLFNAEVILLPMPSKSKICQHNFSLI